MCSKWYTTHYSLSWKSLQAFTPKENKNGPDLGKKPTNYIFKSLYAHWWPHTMFFSNQIRYTKYSTEGTWDPTQEKELFKQVESHTATGPIQSPSFWDQWVQLFNLSCKAEVVRSTLTARNCCSVAKQPHLPRKARETSILWKTTSSLIVHSLLLQHIPPGWLILREGQEQKKEPGRQQKGRGKSKVQRKEKNKCSQGQSRIRHRRDRRGSKESETQGRQSCLCRRK